jgi:hypothetical protein
MNANYTKKLSIIYNNERVIFGKIKRKYKKPISTIGFWEAMARTK